MNAESINLSLPSQDIYYSILIAKEIIENNKNIKKCYLGTGYWTFHFDLSKSIKSTVARIDSNHYEYTTKMPMPNLEISTDAIIKNI
jgi:hypothetical protein